MKIFTARRGLADVDQCMKDEEDRGRERGGTSSGIVREPEKPNSGNQKRGSDIADKVIVKRPGGHYARQDRIPGGRREHHEDAVPGRQKTQYPAKLEPHR